KSFLHDLGARRRRQRARITNGTGMPGSRRVAGLDPNSKSDRMLPLRSKPARMQKILFCSAAPTQLAACCNSGHGPISHLGFRALSKSLVSFASNARCVGSFDAPGEDAMNGYKIKIALKARPRMSLLVVAAAAIALSGALFSAQAQEPIKIGF